MPTVGLYEDEIRAALGHEMNESKFTDLCFQFGLELDEVTSEYEMYKKERGDGFKESDAVTKSKRVVYKVEVPNNRYDLLCHEGLISSLKIFKRLEKVPEFRLTGPASLTMRVKSSTNPLRPFVVCAVLRDVKFTEATYQSFIDLQDKLHHNLCRRRTLVAIGTHDLDKVEGPFEYSCEVPEAIRFVPLNQSVEVDGKGMLALYAQHQQLKSYLPIIAGSSSFPVIRDSKRRVLSVPPIINGDHSKITLSTRNVFIECTATDLTKAGVTLNTMVAMFSRYCEQAFTVEPVHVEYESSHGYAPVAGKSFETPDLSERIMEVPAGLLTRCINPESPLALDTVVDLLARMGLRASVKAAGVTSTRFADEAPQLSTEHESIVQVKVPVTRSDVMHVCDLVEDLCIAYGFNNVVPEISSTLGRPCEQPVNQLSDLLRGEMAMGGFSESLTWALVSLKENFDFLRRPVPKVGEIGAPVRLSNPKTKEFEIVRTSLLPGLLKTLAANKHTPPPMKLFEVSDVVLADPAAEGGARNERRMAAVYSGVTAGFEVVHGLLDQILWSLGCSSVCEGVAVEKKRRGGSYKLTASDDPAFFNGRQAALEVNGQVIGTVGVLHPEVLGAYDIPFAVSALEIQVEPFLEWLKA